MLGDPVDDGAADNDRLGMLGHLAGLLGIGDAEADGDRQLGRAADAGNGGGGRGKRKQPALDLGADVRVTPDGAVRILGALLELAGPRAQALGSGVLSRMLSCLDRALGERIGELSTAVNAGADSVAGAMDGSAGVATYLRACIHLVLASRPASGEDAAAPNPGAEAGRVQALKCLQQAIDWAVELLERLGLADADQLARALVSLPPGSWAACSGLLRGATGGAALPACICPSVR
jgi:hypothetical protein